MEQTPSGRRIASDEPSAQLSVDLGLAYMGMNLYEDALDAFTEALEISSGQMPELWRHVATALVGLYNSHSDVKVFEEVISSPLLTMKAKSEVVSQAIEMCLEQQGPHSASRLLASLPKEIRKLVKNYKVILEQVDSSGLDHGDESRTMSGPGADDRWICHGGNYQSCDRIDRVRLRIWKLPFLLMSASDTRSITNTG